MPTYQLINVIVDSFILIYTKSCLYNTNYKTNLGTEYYLTLVVLTCVIITQVKQHKILINQSTMKLARHVK